MNALDHLWRHFESALFEHGPKAAAALARLSTLYAQLRLRRRPPVRILVDNTVLFHAITHETAWVATGSSNWGAHEVETGYSARIPVRVADANSREYQSVKYLPGIAHLARAGLLTLMSSGELWVERMYQPVGRFTGYGYFDLDLFKDVEMPLVDKIPDMHLDSSGRRSPTIEELRDARLAMSTDPLYRALVRELGPRNSQDAWHIRTAEANGMFCFLTMDFKLIKALEARCRSEPIRALQTKVLTPEDLGKHLRLVPVNPKLLSYQEAISPIRPDLNWPNSARQKPKRRQ